MLLRSAILFASENRLLRRWMEDSPSARPLTRRFVAGTTLEDAVTAIRELKERGLCASLDSLGESVTRPEEAAQSAETYLQSIHHLSLLGLPVTVSLKLTQLGLDLSQELAASHLERIVEAGLHAGIPVEVDMEASPYVDRTLELVRGCHERWGNVRAVVQAYLYRTESDVQDLNARGIPIRLCKGAYKEEADVAFPKKAEVDENYRNLTTLLLSEGTRPAIASHDHAMIQHALSEILRLGCNPDDYEFQMLFGIRRELQQDLARQGHKVRIYVPYGQAWYPYLMRRMAERPANLLFVLRNALRG